MNDPKDSGHVYYDREDGLAHCKVCGGGEGSLPTVCPGRVMTADEADAVYAGTIDFRPEKVQRGHCTLCAGVESPGFYTGCLINDGQLPKSTWTCDGKGRLSRPHGSPT